MTYSEEQLKWLQMAETELKWFFLKMRGIWPYLAENNLLLDVIKELIIFNTASLVVSLLYFLFMHRLFN